MIVIVHGPPAAGKSTLAAELSRALGMPVLSRDEVAEDLYDARAADSDVSLATIRHRAHDLFMDRLAIAAQDDVHLIAEATFDPDRGAERLGAVLGGTRARVVELFVDAPPDVLLRRFRDRARSARHPVHEDAMREPRLAAHLRTCHYRPLGVGDDLVRVTADMPSTDVLNDVLRAIRMRSSLAP